MSNQKKAGLPMPKTLMQLMNTDGGLLLVVDLDLTISIFAEISSLCKRRRDLQSATTVVIILELNAGTTL